MSSRTVHFTGKGYILIGLLLVAALLASGIPTHAAASQHPVKVGVLLPLTGPGAPVSRQQLDNIKLYFEDEVKLRIGARPIKLVVEDDASKADVALTKMRKLVESDKVHVVIGPVFSSTGFAVRDYVIERGIPQVYPIPGSIGESGKPKVQKVTRSADITRAKNIFRANDVEEVLQPLLAEPVYKEMGIKKIAWIGSDYAAGHYIADSFLPNLEGLGGKVLYKAFVPLGAADFAPYLTAIPIDEIDGTVAFVVGANLVNFLRQAEEYRISTRKPLVGSYLLEESSLDGAGDSALHVRPFLSYSSWMDTPLNRSHVEKFVKRFGYRPNSYGIDGYVAAKAVGEAAKAIGGAVEERDRFIKAIQAVQFDSPRGPFRFDKNGIAVVTFYEMKVEKKEGKLQMIPIKTLGTFDSIGLVSR